LKEQTDMQTADMIRWALTEPVDVTAINEHTVLFARTTRAGAFTVEASEDGDLLINGTPATIGFDDLAALCERADTVLAGQPQIGRTVRIEG
jgi:hypothetical protein